MEKILLINLKGLLKEKNIDLQPVSRSSVMSA
jgi:hypothetical protein